MKYQEIEFKYNAENLPLTDFITFCQKLKPKKDFIASGYDHFYEKLLEVDSFCRYRVGPDANQLTFKRKTSDKNNFVRVERNIELASCMEKDDIEGLLEEFGYRYNTSIFKNCFIYVYDWYTLVYYTVFDVNMTEVARFVELEMKETDDWANQEEAYNQLLILEKLCKNIGASPNARIKRSLFELFRKKPQNAA